MDKTVKKLVGHSGSEVYLMEDEVHKYVLKVGNVDRNFERMTALDQAGYPVPRIYNYSLGEYLEMEYIHGLDMKNYLIHHNYVALYEFITDVIDGFRETVKGYKNYEATYHEKLAWLPKDFLFTKDELIDRLPKLLPQSVYHGDLTLENILYTNPGFHLIDPVTIEYDSYIFDLAKLRQDLKCKWFIRNSNVHLDSKLQSISDALDQSYPSEFNDALLILMLLRVLKHCETGDKNYQFLIKEIERLWK